MHELFEADITKFDLIELADWINQCRNAVKKHPDLSDEEYIKKVENFCSEWMEHKKRYESTYQSDLYKKAIVANAVLKKDIFILKINNQRIDCSDLFFKNYSHKKNKDSVKKHKEHKEDTIESYYNMFKNIDKKNLRTEVNKIIFFKEQSTINTYTLEFKDKDKLKEFDLSKQEDVEKILDLPRNEFEDYIEERISLDDYSILKGATTVNKDIEDLDSYIKNMENILENLKTYQIVHSQYYPYVGGSQKDFEKRLFVNFGFYFSLDKELFEHFMNLNGYTILLSADELDEILANCLEVGFDLDYTDILVFKKTGRSLSKRVYPKKRESFDYLDTDNPKTALYYETLKVVIAKLTRFIATKESNLNKRKGQIKNVVFEYKINRKNYKAKQNRLLDDLATADNNDKKNQIENALEKLYESFKKKESYYHNRVKAYKEIRNKSYSSKDILGEKEEMRSLHGTLENLGKKLNEFKEELETERLNTTIFDVSE